MQNGMKITCLPMKCEIFMYKGIRFNPVTSRIDDAKLMEQSDISDRNYKIHDEYVHIHARIAYRVVRGSRLFAL